MANTKSQKHLRSRAAFNDTFILKDIQMMEFKSKYCILYFLFYDRQEAKEGKKNKEWDKTSYGKKITNLANSLEKSISKINQKDVQIRVKPSKLKIDLHQIHNTRIQIHSLL